MKEAKGEHEESIVYDAFRILGVTPNERRSYGSFANKEYKWEKLAENIVEFYFDKFTACSKYEYGDITFEFDGVELKFCASSIFFLCWRSIPSFIFPKFTYKTRK